MIDPQQLRDYIIRPSLKAIGQYSESAEELLMLTAAQETLGGQYVHQVNGPALGIYQMEPRTFDDVKAWTKAKRPAIWQKIEELIIPLKGTFAADIYRKFYLQLFDPFEAERMVWDLYFSTAMARCYYLRKPESLPKADDVEALAGYYKKHWNTFLGVATVDEAIENYNKYA